MNPIVQPSGATGASGHTFKPLELLERGPHGGRVRQIDQGQRIRVRISNIPAIDR